MGRAETSKYEAMIDVVSKMLVGYLGGGLVISPSLESSVKSSPLKATVAVLKIEQGRSSSSAASSQLKTQ